MAAADMPPRRQAPAWAGFAVALWSLIFAARGVYWALGGTVGVGTLSESLREPAEAGDPGLRAILWVTVALEVVAALLGLALTRGRTSVPVPPRLLLFCGWGGGTLLAGHGLSFIAGGLIAPFVGTAIEDIIWYLLFWGPWFLLGGLLLIAASRGFARRIGTTPPERRAAVAGMTAGLLGTIAPLLLPVIAWAVGAG